METAPLAKLPAAVREFFMLTHAEAIAATLPASERDEAARLLLRAWQKRDAAETLWPIGSPAEALRLAKESFALADDGVEKLTALGAEVTLATRARDEARTHANALRTPDLDAEVTEADKEALRALLDAIDAIERAAGRAPTTPKEVVDVRRKRIVWAVVAIAGALAAINGAIRISRAMRATASGVLNVETPASLAIDGDPSTSWLMPDHAPTGWLEVSLGTTRRVNEVRILNGFVPMFDDRAVHDLTIACTDHGHPVKSMNVSLEPTHAWKSFPFGSVQCDALHFEVTSVWRNGGGLAEVEAR